MRKPVLSPPVVAVVVALGILVSVPVLVLAISNYSDVDDKLGAVDEAEGHMTDADRWLHLSGALASESASTSAMILMGRVPSLVEFARVDHDSEVLSARADVDLWLAQAAEAHSMVSMIGMQDAPGDMPMLDNDETIEFISTQLDTLRSQIDSSDIGHEEAVLGLNALANLAGSVAEGHITELISHASAVNAGGQLAAGARTAQAATVLSVRMSEALAIWGVVGFPEERPTLPQVSSLSHAIILLEDGIGDLESTLVPGSEFASEWNGTGVTADIEAALGVMRATRQPLLQSVINEQAFPDPSELTPKVVEELRRFDDPFGSFIELETGLFALSLDATEEVEAANEQLRAEAVTQRNRVIALLMALVLVGVIALATTVGLVVRPLRRLSSVLRSAADGDLHLRAPVAGTREVRSTAESFNQAIDALERVEQKALALADERLDAEVLHESTPGRLGEAVDAAVVRLADSLAEREDFQRRLAYESSHDALTMLPNRRAMFERLRSALARSERNGSVVAMLHLDLDGFKAVNDQIGHHAGDRYLRQLAQRMAATVRPGDTVARIGGDEFAVIAEPVSDATEAQGCVRRLREALAEPFSTENDTVVIGLSVGMALSEPGLTAEDLFHRADLALHRSKELGPGNVVVCDEELLRSTDERVELDTAIVDGLDADEFELHYQPIIDSETGRMVSLEALIRWDRPGHGMVPPGQFIPHAEWSDLIIEIDRWVLRRAVDQAKQWDSHPVLSSVPISVNFSGRHMSSGRLADHVLSCLAECDLDPKRVVVEMTESALVDDLNVASREWARLRSAGVRVALDDFGTGFMSLAVLRSLQADSLKIDQSFIDRIDDPRELSLVQLMVDAGHLLGAVIVAEGVETEVQRDILVGLGVERLQGFFFSRPMSTDRLVESVGALV